MDYFRRLEPTPSAIRNGRLVGVAVAGIVVAILALMVFVPGFGDPSLLAVVAATIVTVIGHGIAYLGQPTLTRYRIGLVVIAIGIVASFWFLIAFAPPSN